MRREVSLGRFRLVTLNRRCDLISSQSNHGRRWGKKVSELPGVQEDFGGGFQLELKLQASVRGFTNKGLHYVTHLVFLCELFHNKVSLVSPPPQTFHRFQAASRLTRRETIYLKAKFKWQEI